MVEMPDHAHGPVPSRRFTPVCPMASSLRHSFDRAESSAKRASTAPAFPSAPRSLEPSNVKAVGRSTESNLSVAGDEQSCSSTVSPPGETDHLPPPHGDETRPPCGRGWPVLPVNHPRTGLDEGCGDGRLCGADVGEAAAVEGARVAARPAGPPLA